MFFFIDIFFIEKVRRKIFFLFLAYPPPQIDVQREIKADADFLCQFLLELNISMDPSIVLCNVFFARIQYQYTMDPSIVLCNVFAHRLLYLWIQVPLNSEVGLHQNPKMKEQMYNAQIENSKSMYHIFSKSLCSPGHVSSRAKPIHPHHSAIENQWLYRPEQIPLWSRKRFQDSHKLSSYQTCINIFFANKTGFHNSNAE